MTETDKSLGFDVEDVINSSHFIFLNIVDQAMNYFIMSEM